MNRLLRRLVIAVVSIAILLGVGLALLPRIFPLNQYKPQIIALVARDTGRTLSLAGPLRWTVFPWLGIEANDVTLGNPPGFPATPMVSAAHAGVSVKILPLFLGRIEIKDLRVDHLQLQLIRRADGATNWAGPASRAQPASQTAKSGASPALSLPAISAAGIAITHGHIDYYNAQSGQHITVTDADITAGRFAPGQVTPVTASADVKVGQGAGHALALNADIGWSRDRSTITLALHELGVAGLSFSGNSRLVMAPRLSLTGRLALAPGNVRAALGAFGVPFDAADPTALTHVDFDARIAGTATDLRVSPFTLHLDGETLSGQAQITTTAGQHRYRLGLSANRLDLDRYRPAPAPAVATTASRAPSRPIALPSRVLRDLNADVNLNVGALTAFGFHLSDVHATVTAHQGLIEASPVSALAYGGRYTGLVRYDARTDTPVITTRDQLAHIHLHGLLVDAHHFARFHGLGNVTLALEASGPNPAALTRTLNGTASVDLAGGRIDGIDFAKIAAQASSIGRALRGQPPAAAAPATSDSTPFSRLSASATIAHGIVANRDFLLVAPLLTAHGQGTIDLPGSQLDYHLTLDAQNAAGHTQATIPLVLSGPLASPRYRVDLSTLIRANEGGAIDKAKERLKNELLKGLLR